MTTPARTLLTPQMRRRLVSARKAKPLYTQEALAKKIRCVSEYVSLLESGTRQPSFRVLDRWCTALGLELEVRIK